MMKNGKINPQQRHTANRQYLDERPELLDTIKEIVGIEYDRGRQEKGMPLSPLPKNLHPLHKSTGSDTIYSPPFHHTNKI